MCARPRIHDNQSVCFRVLDSQAWYSFLRAAPAFGDGLIEFVNRSHEKMRLDFFDFSNLFLFEKGIISDRSQ